jgi:RecB family exonuclease
MPVVLKEVGGVAEQSSSPLPGHLYVCDLRHAGWSGREQVYVLGMDGDSMPGKAEINPVLLDEDRAELARRLGVALPDAHARVRRRTEDFRALLRRVRGTLTVSWARMEADKLHPLAPSREVLALFRGVREQPDADYSDLERALPRAEGDVPAEWPLSLSEYFLLRGATRPRAEAMAALLAHYPLQRAGQEAIAARASRNFTAFDGFVGPHMGEDDRSFALSPSTLESFSRCPYKAFLQKLLRVQPPPSSEFDATQWMNPADLGSCAHAVFQHFILRRSATHWPVEQWESEAHAVIEDVLHDYIDEHPAPNESALRVARGKLRSIASIFLRHERQQPKLRILGVELRIDGDELPLPPLRRPQQQPRFPTPEGTLLLRGRVDRVDMNAEGNIRIVDYKTGSMKSNKALVLKDGLPLQPGLYAAALRAMLPGSEAHDLRFSYLHISDKEQGVEVPHSVDDPGLAETVGHLLRAWRDGVFPHAIDAGACGYCEFRELCGPPRRVCEESLEKLDNADNNMLDAWRELQHGE